MKYIILLFAFVSIICTGCQPSYKIYIVRHAEKGTEPTNNPHLTEKGSTRAEALKYLLKDKNIGHIYSTNTSRTMETALPLSQQINVPVQYYGMDTVDRFLQNVVNLKTNTLIVGHSNTLLPLLDKMNLQHNLKAIGDNDYNNLFMVTVKKGKTIKVEETTYGSH